MPNEYKLKKEIIDNILKSYNYGDIIELPRMTFNEKQKVLEEICFFYHTYIEKRVKSSIPRIIGKTKDDYSYEVLHLNDPLILNLGYLTKSCFRIDGESSDF